MKFLAAVLLCELLLFNSCNAAGVLQEPGAHAHEDHEDDANCAVSSSQLSHEFSELAVDMRLYGEDGELCSAEVEGHMDHDHDEEDHDEEDHNEEEHEDDDLLDPACDSYYQFGKQLLLRLNLTTPCCLGNKTSCSDDHDHAEDTITSSTRTAKSKAYGYGFLMVMVVSLASLLGILVLPVAKNPRLKNYYDYVYALLISLGASALFCDAVLHLIPEALGLHDHAAAQSTAHAHAADEEEEDELQAVWQSCVIILGMYAFFLFEFVLHSLTSHPHSHSRSHSTSISNSNSMQELAQAEVGENRQSKQKKEGLDTKTTQLDSAGETGNGMIDVTFPHGTCHSNSVGSSILHPSLEQCSKESCSKSSIKIYGKKCGRYIWNIKPLAWLILVGDSIHNFADGLALGAAISQSLSLGISTAIAIVFHEIPHELGDFFVLLSTGMSWYAAICFNFVSALTAVLGFFVGVAVGTSNESANNWILALAAGVFLYIALVDLLPELIHCKEKRLCKRMLLFVMVNIGFLISFLALLLLAIYEEDLNTLVTV